MVAPLAGAWIETDQAFGAKGREMSPPSRGRGSKPVAATVDRLLATRRPPRGGVDRNFIISARASPSDVAPLAGAWIETSIKPTRSQPRRRRPPRGGVDRNFLMSYHDRKGTPLPRSRGRGSKPREAELDNGSAVVALWSLNRLSSDRARRLMGVIEFRLP